MKGYKGVNNNMICLDMQYEQGVTYAMDGKIELCKRGFHFCEHLGQCFSFYDKFKSRFFEVEADGEIIRGIDKNCCSRITFGREIEGRELYRYIYGYGDGYGYGYGDGYGYGYGYGYGEIKNENIQKILDFKED